MYNRLLDRKMLLYRQFGVTLKKYDAIKQPPALKEEKPWLKEADSTALQAAAGQMFTAYDNFFRGCKTGKPVGYPRFRKKKAFCTSYKTKTNIKLGEKHIRLAKLGWVRCAVSKQIRGRIISATVTVTQSGKFFVSVCFDDADIQPLDKTGAAAGIDLGCHDLAKSVEDSAFGEIRRQLKYKAAWYGKTLVAADRFYPSSQLCHCCGFQNPEVKGLSIREWECPSYGAYHDRDVNAVINILNEGLRLLAEVSYGRVRHIQTNTLAEIA